MNRSGVTPPTARRPWVWQGLILFLAVLVGATVVIRLARSPSSGSSRTDDQRRGTSHPKSVGAPPERHLETFVGSNPKDPAATPASALLDSLDGISNDDFTSYSPAVAAIRKALLDGELDPGLCVDFALSEKHAPRARGLVIFLLCTCSQCDRSQSACVGLLSPAHKDLCTSASLCLELESRPDVEEADFLRYARIWFDLVLLGRGGSLDDTIALLTVMMKFERTNPVSDQTQERIISAIAAGIELDRSVWSLLRQNVAARDLACRIITDCSPSAQSFEGAVFYLAAEPYGSASSDLMNTLVSTRDERRQAKAFGRILLAPSNEILDREIAGSYNRLAGAEAKVACIQCLVVHGTSESMGQLEQLLKTEQDPRLRSQAALVIVKAAPSQAVSECVRLLRVLAQDRDKDVRSQVAQAAARLSGRAGLPVLDDLLGAETDPALKEIATNLWLDVVGRPEK